MLAAYFKNGLVCVYFFVFHQESHVGCLIIIKSQLERVIHTRAGCDLSLHGDVCDAWSGEAAEHVVKGDEGRLSGGHNTLTPALSPHVHPAVLGDGRRDVIVVGGGHLHYPPEVLAHLGRGARVGFVSGP